MRKQRNERPASVRIIGGSEDDSDFEDDMRLRDFIKMKNKEKTSELHKDSDTDEGPSCPKRSKYDRKDFPKLMSRTSPNTLVSALRGLNNLQKNAVKSLGFGCILDLKITEIPSRLARWVVEHFDPCSFDLNLEKGKVLHVDECDVRRVFGFPMGGRPIRRVLEFQTKQYH